MHMAHLSGNTSGVSKSSSDWLDYTGFPGDVCVAFFNVPPGNKMLWRQTPSRKKKAVVFTADNERLSGSTKHWISKVCEKFKVHGIESLQYVREFYTPVWYCGDISMPLNMTWHKSKRDWLLYLSVIWPLGWDLAIQSGQSSQTFSRQSGGLATRD